MASRTAVRGGAATIVCGCDAQKEGGVPEECVEEGEKSGMDPRDTQL